MAENGEKGKLLSSALMGFLRRRAMEACGLLLILAGGALTAMLFSPGRLDPSWSAFSPGPVNNWFGPVGAAIAGGLRTSLGAASFFATLLPLGWGYRLLRKQEIGLGLSTGFGHGSIVCSCLGGALCRHALLLGCEESIKLCLLLGLEGRLLPRPADDQKLGQQVSASAARDD